MIRQNRLPIESPPDTMPHHTFYLPNGNAYDLNKHSFIFNPSPLYCTCQCAKSLRHLEEVSFRIIGIESQENLGYKIAFFLWPPLLVMTCDKSLINITKRRSNVFLSMTFFVSHEKL